MVVVAPLQLTPPQIQRSAYAVAFDERFSIPLDPAALEEDSLRILRALRFAEAGPPRRSALPSVPKNRPYVPQILPLVPFFQNHLAIF